MIPPWIKYPNIPIGSIGWNMGIGEAYIDEFLKWFYSKAKNERVEIIRKYPEPEDWDNFYAC